MPSAANQRPIVINSTVHDKHLATEVRAIWGKLDYRQKLLDFSQRL